ncbi:MAG: hypothetical protein JWP91_3157 [Fibrobacteres bacterium]|nr:hypothetical protein [Fibrobacterota bacterium]
MTFRLPPGRRHQDHVANNLARDFRRTMLNIGSKAFLTASALGAVAMMAAAEAAENYSTWGRASDLILDTSPAGADVPGPLSDFPLLVRLNASNFTFAEARGRGQDIRFSDAAGSPLDYQIERWDSARALAEIWVRIPLVSGNAAGQTYHMHWGKSTAADSSDGRAVFSNHQVAVWHMGGTGANARANSAPGGQAAQPYNYESDKSRDGIIAKADTLDGQDPGDYLDIGDGYQDFSGGFSFSIWAYPTAVKNYARFFELGNGESADNIMLTRDGTSDDLRFDNYNPGATVSTVKSGAAISLNQWQQFGVNVSTSGLAKIYKNGAVIAQGQLTNTVANVWRASNFLGKSNWTWDAYFQGMLDEPALSNISHSDNWYKLCYQNQRQAQTLVTVKRPALCQSRFKGQADTAVNEGATVNLTGTADCATGVSWSVLSGPAPRILDPEMKVLTVAMPRVSGETVIVYRFAAAYADSSPYKDVRVTIRETVPDPDFTMPPLTAWDGKIAVAYRPAIANLSAIKASASPVIHWAWTLSGVAADTAWLADGLNLKTAAAEGPLQIGLCLDNSGARVCKSASITVSRTAGSTSSLIDRTAASAKRPGDPRADREWRDASGRLRTGAYGGINPGGRFAGKSRPAP